MITITHTTITPCKPLQAIYRRVGVNSLSCSLCIHDCKECIHWPVWGKDGPLHGPHLWCPVNIAVDKINGCWYAYFPHMRGNQSKERGERFASQNRSIKKYFPHMQIDTTEDFSGVANLSKSFTTVNPYSTVKTTAPPVKIFYYSL